MQGISISHDGNYKPLSKLLDMFISDINFPIKQRRKKKYIFFM